MRVFLNNGNAYFDTRITDNFDFPRFCNEVRANGYFANGQVFVPYAAIGFMAVQTIPKMVADTLEATLEAKGATRQ